MFIHCRFVPKTLSTETDFPPTSTPMTSQPSAKYQPSSLLLSSTLLPAVDPSGTVNRYHRFPPTVPGGCPHSLSSHSERLGHGCPFIDAKFPSEWILRYSTLLWSRSPYHQSIIWPAFPIRRVRIHYWGLPNGTHHELYWLVLRSLFRKKVDLLSILQ